MQDIYRYWSHKESDYFQTTTTTTTTLKTILFIEIWDGFAPFVYFVGQVRVQFRSAVAVGGLVLHPDLPVLKHLNYPLSVSKATVICHPVILRWMRWLPRLSQPVQCKDRKSQGSTSLTPRPASPTQTRPFTNAPKLQKWWMPKKKKASVYWSSKSGKKAHSSLQVSLIPQTDQLIEEKKALMSVLTRKSTAKSCMDHFSLNCFKYFQSSLSTLSELDGIVKAAECSTCG